jgi:hypothetical protein
MMTLATAMWSIFSYLVGSSTKLLALSGRVKMSREAANARVKAQRPE